MRRKIPCIYVDRISWAPQITEVGIEVGTTAWYIWLDHTSSFSYTSPHGTFTARKEHFQRGGWYWKAYRKQQGQQQSAYLGRSEKLTTERMEQVAQKLASHNRSMISQTPNTPVFTRSTHQDEPLLMSKVQIPLLRANSISRPRLTQWLNTLSDIPLIIFAAPAGYGKTTVITEWLAQCQQTCAWLSLDIADNDLSRFWSYVILALKTARPDLSRRLGKLCSSPIQTMLAGLINTISSQPDPIILILDSYHTIELLAIHETLSFLLDHLPSQLRVIIASRVDPPLLLIRQRVSGCVCEVHMSDLRFSSEEMTVFFQQSLDQHLTQEMLKVLSLQTEGWVAGMQLIAAFLHGYEDREKRTQALMQEIPRILSDYFLEEVLRRQPEQLQTFLLQTSILDRFCSPLCDAVTGHHDSQMLLDYLVQSHLFIVDLGDTWYRYHPFFVIFLRRHLSQNFPKQIKYLYRRAALWFSNSHLTTEAVNCALLAKDVKIAIRLIEQIAEKEVQRGELSTVLAWLQALPHEAIQQRPYLCLIYARVLLAIGYAEEADAYTQTAAKLLDMYNDKQIVKHDYRLQELHGMHASMRGEIAAFQGNYHRAIACYQQALADLPKTNKALRTDISISLGTAYLATGDISASMAAYRQGRTLGEASDNIQAVLESLYRQGTLLSLQGHLPEASATFIQALKFGIAAGDIALPRIGLSSIGLGMILFEWNDSMAAECYLHEGMQLTLDLNHMQALISGHATLARLKFAAQEMDRGYEHLAALEQIGYSPQLAPSLITYVATVCVRLWLIAGDTRKAALWAQKYCQRCEELPDFTNEAMYLIHARLLIAQGQYKESLVLLKRLIPSIEGGGRRGRRFIEALALLALAHWHCDARHDAFEVLIQALDLGERSGYIRSFVELGSPFAILLQEFIKMPKSRSRFSQHQIAHTYVQKILTVQRSTFNTNYSSPPPALLSEREIEIVRLIGAGKSNGEIAQALILELSTVKWHIKNIYNKLYVHNRILLVTRARELNLLEFPPPKIDGEQLNP